MNLSGDRFITGGENIYPSYEGDHFFTFAEPPDRFILESGMPLGPITVNYQTYGTLSPSGDNTVYLAHALTGGSLAGKHSKPEKESGWWEPLVGPGKAIDTDRFFVICSNVLGSCYGTTGPSSIDLSRGKNYAMNFPVVTIGDMVRVQKKLLDHLGVRELVCAVGGSMGGMQALQWAVYYPDMVRSVIAVACSAVFSPIGIAFNQAERKAIMNDLSWRQGDYYGTSFPHSGLSLARMIGTITYRSNESFEQRFGRSFQNADRCNQFAFHEQFAVESYLNYQGEKVTYRFDPNSYLYLSKAMDLHDMGRGFTSFQAALKRIRCPIFLMGINTDILFYPQEVRGLAVEMRRCGIDAYYEELKSPHGHDSFLIEFKEMERYIKYCLSDAEKQ